MIHHLLENTNTQHEWIFHDLGNNPKPQLGIVRGVE